MNSLPLFTIYWNPTDYRGRFVVRRFVVGAGEAKPDPEPLAVAASLDEVRAAIQAASPGAIRLERKHEDDPVIVENWI